MASDAWRSALYPEDWTPDLVDSEGRFLHDFSYAGYRGGTEPIPTPTGPVVDVRDHGAVPDDQTDCTTAFQAAIDEASTAGGVVSIPTGTWRIDGVLDVRASGVVLRGEGRGSLLHFTRTDGMSDTAHLTFAGTRVPGVEALAVSDIEPRSFAIEVADPTGFAPGDPVEIGWVITDAFVADHDMTGTWQVFNGTWQTFWRRTVVGVTPGTPAVITLDAPHRYPGLVRDGVSIVAVDGHLEQVGLVDLAVTNAQGVAAAEANDRNHLIDFVDVRDGWVTGVESAHHLGEAGGQLQSGGIRLLRTARFTLEHSRFSEAQNHLERGNGYLVEVSQVSDVLIHDVVAIGGRHNFIQNWGFGTTGVVWKDCHSEGATANNEPLPNLDWPAYSEFHHSLATANLIDGGTWNDGWTAENRGDWSSGAGFAATQNAFWNPGGTGILTSDQYGWGYVIGASPELQVLTDPLLGPMEGLPEDWVEPTPEGRTLEPESLFEDQRIRRLGTP